MSEAATRTASADAVLLREDAAGIATLILNRPKQYNALSEVLLTALQEQFDVIAKDESVRVVVLAGSGKAFCAGHDLKQMRANPDRAYYQALFGQCGHLMMTLIRLPQPVIAKVHGIATAAGCQLVAACDLAIASTEARFATSGINVGLFCSVPGVPVARNVPRKPAMEMLLTGDFISAERAAELGLINHAVPAESLDQTVSDLAKRIAQKPPVAVRLGKELFYRQLELDVRAAYGAATDVMAANMMADDTCEGIDAFIEKRPPRWDNA